MATNICSRSRRNFISVEKIASQYDVTVQDIYAKLKKPEFAEAVVRIGNRGVRVDQDKFFEILTQVYR